MDDQLRLEIYEAIKAVIRDAAASGSRPNNRCYLRVRPDGSVDISYEPSYSISIEEYYCTVPHTLSLEISEGTRDFSDAGDFDAEEAAQAAADGFLDDWEQKIDGWIDAGNLRGRRKR